MALQVKMNTMDLDDLDTDIPLFATIEDEENDHQGHQREDADEELHL